MNRVLTISSAILSVLSAANTPKPMTIHRAVAGSHRMWRSWDQGVDNSARKEPTAPATITMTMATTTSGR